MKIVKVERDGELFVMNLSGDRKHKEKWFYERVETGTGVSYIQVNREID
jgi:hypothetical protein